MSAYMMFEGLRSRCTTWRERSGAVAPCHTASKSATAGMRNNSESVVMCCCGCLHTSNGSWCVQSSLIKFMSAMLSSITERQQCTNEYEETLKQMSRGTAQGRHCTAELVKIVCVKVALTLKDGG
ncbi:hypothetical protein E2C01_083709 [Portunus trituberculatus]|uniref:Uncharacterized protein n=1 Tax=Portunus trituberculatus TaxID=210409 RepID=A0A5B7J5K4_PORTR|nr:hypothetical protein [Portunus trituberculatus]